jgi:septal ring factor EnvC (AmiA/AmiB activator)
MLKNILKTSLLVSLPLLLSACGDHSNSQSFEKIQSEGEALTNRSTPASQRADKLESQAALKKHQDALKAKQAETTQD